MAPTLNLKIVARILHLFRRRLHVEFFFLPRNCHPHLVFDLGRTGIGNQYRINSLELYGKFPGKEMHPGNIRMNKEYE